MLDTVPYLGETLHRWRVGHDRLLMGARSKFGKGFQA
jgi:hypothetical protein